VQDSAGSDVPSSSPGSARDRAFRVAILLVALGLRLAVARQARLIEVDGAYWGGLARAIARGDWTHGLSAAWPPLYPALIAGVERLLAALGASASPATFEWSARLVSIACGVLLILPLGALARRTLPPRWDLLVMALAAVHPRLVEYSAAALSESLFTLLLISGVAALATAADGRASGARAVAVAALGGAAMGCAFLARPEGILFGIVIAGAAIAARRGRPADVAAFAAVMLIVAAQWLAFLHRETGAWTPGEKGAYNFWREHRDAWARHFPPPEVLAARVDRSPELAPRAVPGEFRGASLLAAEPGAVLGRTARNLARLLFDTLPVTIGWPVAVLAIIGLLARPGPWVWVPLAFAPLLDAPFTIDRRLLVPVVPFALIAAASACVAIERRWGRRVVGVVIALLLPGLAIYSAVISARGDPARELRVAGEWLGAHSEARLVVMARKPQVAFYAGGLIVPLPVSRDSALDDADRIPADVIVVDARSTHGDRGDFTSWLDPAEGPSGWRPLARWEGGAPIVLYVRDEAPVH